MSVCAGALFIGVSGVFLLIGLVLTGKTIRLLFRGVRTEATVVDFEADDEGARYPVVEFVDQSGEMRRVKLSVSGRGEPLGSTSNIIYDAGDPNYLLATTFTQMWLFPLAFTVMGGGGVLIGVGILIGIMPMR